MTGTRPARRRPRGPGPSWPRAACRVPRGRVSGASPAVFRPSVPGLRAASAAVTSALSTVSKGLSVRGAEEKEPPAGSVPSTPGQASVSATGAGDGLEVGAPGGTRAARAPPQPRQRTLCARALRTWAAVESGATPRHSGTVSPVQAGPSRPGRRRLRVSGAHRVTLTSPGTPSPPEASASQPQPAPPRALLPGVPASSPPSARGVPLLHPLR